jgi:hypothetical protein
VLFTKNNRGLAASCFAEKLRIDPQLVLRSRVSDEPGRFVRAEDGCGA